MVEKIVTFLKSLFADSRDEPPVGIFCRKCRNNMWLGGSFVSDSYDENGDNHVRYKCAKCGLESDYNFDIAPVPINWLDIKRGG